MAYQVTFTSKAERQFDKLPDAVRQRLAPAIDALGEDPRPHGVVKLQGAQPIYRIRVGDYRVVYEIRDNVLVVLVLRLGHRRDIYEK